MLAHVTAGYWWTISDNNEWFDTAAAAGVQSPWSVGGFQWTIPNHYRCLGHSDSGSLYATSVQTFTIAVDGTMTVSKVGQTTTRTP